MTAIWPLAVITFREGIRNRALYGISIFALLLFAANHVICSMILRDVGKVAVDIALSTVSFSGLLVVLFVGINLIAKDFDRKTIYMVLSRPISRTHYIFGKFFGMAMLVVTTTTILGLLALVSVIGVKATYPSYFPRFDLSLIILSLVMITISLLLLSSLTFLFASFTSTSFISLILTVICYLIGQIGSDVRALIAVKDAVGIKVSPFTSKIVTVSSYVFPNFSLFDIKLYAAHGLPVAFHTIIWTLSYGFTYMFLTLVTSAFIFRYREFP